MENLYAWIYMRKDGENGKINVKPKDRETKYMLNSQHPVLTELL